MDADRPKNLVGRVMADPVGLKRNEMPEALHEFNRKDLHRFFADLLTQTNWSHLLPFVEKLDELLILAGVYGLVTFTSHERLLFSKHTSYPEWFEDDTVVITPLTSGNVDVEYVKPKESTSEKSVTVSYQQLVPTLKSMLELLKNT